MIADLKPYPAYKDSGVGWLGKVPEHWEVRRLGQIGRLSKGRGGNKDDEVSIGVPCVRYGDLYTTHTYFILKSRSFVSRAKVENYTPIKFGDVLFAASGETIDEIGKSAVNLIQSEACCGGDVILFRPERQVEARYLGYATDCRPAAAQKATMGRGFTVMHIYGGQLKYLTLPLPPLPEQTAIVRYLDYTDRRIQRYIQAKQKLIALLEEQKQAIIHQAVTGQIDVRTGQPYPAYQDSGVEWLGEVPEHWEVRKLRHCGTVSGGMTPSMEVRRFWGGPVPWVTPKDMKRAVISDSSVRVTDSALQETPLRLIEPPAVLIVVRGMILARRVPIAYTAAPVTINQDMKAFRTLKGTGAVFLARLLDSAQEAFMPLIDEAGHGTRRLPMERWREIVIAVPPVEEQANIVECLDNRTAAIDTTISHTQRQIDLLSEYRTRLISDVVTGKLDVREAAAALPEVDPLEAEADSEETLEPTTELGSV